jgi:hypothetical protein
MEARLREIIRTIVKEIQSEKELEEMTGTGAVAGYDTPNAFSKPGQTGKKNNRLAKVTGGEVVDDLEEAKDWLKNDVPADSKKPLAIKPTAISSADAGGIAERGGVVPTTADFKLPDRGGLLLAPSAIDTVQLSASGIASSAVAAVNLIRQEAGPAISNGVELERVTIPAPPVFGAEATAITNTPSQQMSGEA